MSVTPPVGEAGRHTLDDIGLLTGAAKLGASSATAACRSPEDLGRALRIEFINKTLIVLPAGERRQAVQGAVEQLRRRVVALDPEDEQRAGLIQRLATLTGGVGQLKIGAYHKQARNLRRTQAERAWKMLSSTQRSGVVPGGGAALVHCVPAVNAAFAVSRMLTWPWACV